MALADATGMVDPDRPSQGLRSDRRSGRAPSSSTTARRSSIYVLPHHEAIEYPVAVGAEAFGWTGRATVGHMTEWPTWMPTSSIMSRWPEFKAYIKHGPLEGRWDNPLGARALYLYQGNKRHAVPHPRHQRAGRDRAGGVVGLHPHARPRRDRSLQPRENRHAGDRAQLIRLGALGREGRPHCGRPFSLPWRARERGSVIP